MGQEKQGQQEGHGIQDIWKCVTDWAGLRKQQDDFNILAQETGNGHAID